MASVVDVAGRVLRRLRGPVGAVELHWLVYYAQGWHLVAHAVPLFGEAVHAAGHGPVVRELWGLHRGDREVRLEHLSGSGGPQGKPLDPLEADVVDAVVDAYGSFDGCTLRETARQESPWAAAWASPSGKEITTEAIEQHFARAFMERRAGEIVPPLPTRSRTLVTQADLDAFGDLDTAGDISRLMRLVKP